MRNTPLILILIVSVFTNFLFGGSGILHYRPEFHRTLPIYSAQSDTDTVQVESSLSKYPARGLLMSLVVPGAGQWYAGAKAKSLIYAAVEVVNWVAWYQLKKNGENIRITFEDFADTHWSLKDWVVFTDILRAYDENKYGDVVIEGTHHLRIVMPDDNIVSSDTLVSTGYIDGMDVIRDRDFYENIGKYDQFVAGWDDTGLEKGEKLWWDFEKDVGDTTEWIVMTKNREKYLNKRSDYNKSLQWAGYAVSAIMFNHVISAIDAALETRKRSNKTHKVETSIDLMFSPYARYGVGGLKLSLNW